MKAQPLCLVVALALASCGDFPRPFQGSPGTVAAHLALPPPPLLAVPNPSDALLPANADERFAAAIAAALADHTVPAVARTPAKGDWRLLISATMRKGEVIPRYTVVDPTHHRQGVIAGGAVPIAAWSKGDPSTLSAVASEDAGPIATSLTAIDARLKRSNPDSLMNRPARVYFAGVSNAPGDGDTLLSGAMQRDLPALGVRLQKEKQGADFTVSGKVSVTPAAGARKRVDLEWVVTDAQGRERGRVVQLNDVATRTIQPSWSAVSSEIAEQAAGGIRDLIEKARMAP